MRIVKIDLPEKGQRLDLFFERTFLPSDYGFDYRKRVSIIWEPFFNRRRRWFMFDAGFKPNFPKIRQVLYLYFLIIEYENYG
jgi:hypothetical protein